MIRRQEIFTAMRYSIRYALLELLSVQDLSPASVQERDLGLKRTCVLLFPPLPSTPTKAAVFTHQHFYYSRHQRGQEPRWSVKDFRAKADSPAQDPTQHQSESRAGFPRQSREHPCPAPTSSTHPTQLLWPDLLTQASCSPRSTPTQG